MYQERRVQRLFQRRSKCLHQSMREVGDKTDSVSNNNAAQALNVDACQRWIECGKQLISCVDTGLRPRVKQRRLTGIGVPHQRYQWHLCALPRPAILSPLLPHFI